MLVLSEDKMKKRQTRCDKAYVLASVYTVINELNYDWTQITLLGLKSKLTQAKDLKSA